MSILPGRQRGRNADEKPPSASRRRHARPESPSPSPSLSSSNARPASRHAQRLPPAAAGATAVLGSYAELELSDWTVVVQALVCFDEGCIAFFSFVFIAILVSSSILAAYDIHSSHANYDVDGPLSFPVISCPGPSCPFMHLEQVSQVPSLASHPVMPYLTSPEQLYTHS